MIFLDDDWTTRDQTVVQSHNTMKFFKSKKLPTISKYCNNYLEIELTSVSQLIYIKITTRW